MSAVPVPVAAPRGPWGAWATIGFTVVILIVFAIAQLVVSIPYLLIRTVTADDPAGGAAAFDKAVDGLERDGLFLAVTEIVTAPVLIGLVLLVAWLRKGPALREYLAWKPVPRRTLLLWLLATVAFAGVLDVAAMIARHPPVPDWMMDIWRTAGFVPLLLLALVVAAPIVEELLFRGFVFEGLHRSRLGVAGTIVLASLVWSAIHGQYAWFYVGQIFASGLLLGAARAATGSLIPPVLMHAMLNVTATLQVALQSRG